MNAEAWLRSAQAQLTAAGITSARLDALILLEDCLTLNRAQLLARLETALSDTQCVNLDSLLARRLVHEPLAYIRGHSEFYGRQFYVNKQVLVPRPESEMMIEILKTLPLEKPRLADIGTGSGALAITAALELPGAVVYATDVDEACLAVARRNAGRHQAKVTFVASDLLANFTPPVDLLLCNLPYVPDDYPINDAAGHEPRLALFGGPDGLDLYRRLFHQLGQLPNSPGLILCESLPQQHQPLAAIAQQGGYHLQQTRDFIQVFGTGSDEFNDLQATVGDGLDNPAW